MLVLASASPRRQELLRNAGIAFIVQPTDIPEVAQEGELPRDFAERMAREKAEAVFRVRPNDFVLGADTIVVVDGTILGKPRDSADAARMLRLLSGRAHQVISGVCLMGPELRTGSQDIRSETTLVTMAKLSDKIFAPTLQPESLSIRPALTGFKVWLRGGFRALKAITLTWWGYQWRWYGECCTTME